MIEPSLNAPPVYRRMLAGGAEPLRLSRAGVAAVLAGAAALAGVLWFRRHVGWDGPDVAFWSTWLGAGATALVVALLVARWLAGPLATAAGLLCLSAAAVLPGAIDAPPGAVAAGAFALFALANVPGRLRVVTRPEVAWGCFALIAAVTVCFGPLTGGAILATCVAMVLAGQNSRALRQFIRPAPLAILAVGAAVWLICGPEFDYPGVQPHRLLTLAVEAMVALLPWSPMAVVALVVGVRQGHWAAPFWRLVGCWIAAPVVLAPLGILQPPAALAICVPGLAILTAAGAAVLLPAVRRRWAR